MVDPSQRQVVVAGGSGPGEIGNLTVRFVRTDPDPEARERTVSMAEAASAVVSYVRDGRAVTDEWVSVGEAVTLIEQAGSDATAAATRARSPRRPPSDAAAPALTGQVSCPVCDGREFDEQDGQPPTRLLVCVGCGFVLQYRRGPLVSS